MSDKPCGCDLEHVLGKDEEESYYRIIYCPLHAAAPDLLEACEAARNVFADQGYEGWTRDLINDAVASAKEKP